MSQHKKRNPLAKSGPAKSGPAKSGLRKSETWFGTIGYIFKSIYPTQFEA